MLIFKEDARERLEYLNNVNAGDIYVKGSILHWNDNEWIITPDQKKELKRCLDRARGMQKNIVPQGDGVKLKKACDQYELILSRIKFES